MTPRIAVLVAVLLASLVTAGLALAEGPKLSGKVGPGFSISLVDAGGARVTHLDPGPFELEVDDLADVHNFHLTGPGVDVATPVDTAGKQTFQLTLRDGVYTFMCDPHALTMKGSFAVGTAALPAPEVTPRPITTPTPSAPVGARLVLTSGPGFTISLKTVAGKAVKLLRPGAYTILVRDRSGSHNAHVLGAGVNRKTTVPGTASTTWRVVLKKGALVFQCDPHKDAGMRGSVKVA